jgi:hypothetical protein
MACMTMDGSVHNQAGPCPCMSHSLLVKVLSLMPAACRDSTFLALHITFAIFAAGLQVSRTDVAMTRSSLSVSSRSYCDEMKLPKEIFCMT